MKKTFMILILLLAFTLILCGCTSQNNTETTQTGKITSNIEETSETTESTAAGDTTSTTDDNWVDTSFGTFLLADGWSEFSEISSASKTFYVKDGSDTSTPVSNISIEIGENKYLASDHENFRLAILQQLGAQASNETINGSGSSTANGDIMYIFTIESQESITVQYYIIGDYKFCLIHVTDFGELEITDVNDVAKEIANSFVWNE